MGGVEPALICLLYLIKMEFIFEKLAAAYQHTQRGIDTVKIICDTVPMNIR